MTRHFPIDDLLLRARGVAVLETFGKRPVVVGADVVVEALHDPLADLELLVEPGKTAAKPESEDALLDVSETELPVSYGLPVTMKEPPDKLHLENFFAAIRGKSQLTCPGEIEIGRAHV